MLGNWNRYNSPITTQATALVRGSVIECNDGASGESKLAIVWTAVSDWSKADPDDEDQVSSSAVVLVMPLLYRELGPPIPVRLEVKEPVRCAVTLPQSGGVIKVEKSCALVAGDEPPFSLVRVSLTGSTAERVSKMMEARGPKDLVVLPFLAVGFEDGVHFCEDPCRSASICGIDDGASGPRG